MERIAGSGKAKGLLLVCVIAGVLLQASPSWGLPEIRLEVGDGTSPTGLPMTLKIVLFLTVLSLAPALAILVTSFTRIIVVFSFLKQAIGQQQVPPNQILVGLALFLTVFIMAPVWQDVQQNALKPLMAKEITETEAWNRALKPIREFMFHHTREKDLGLFLEVAGKTPVVHREDVPTYVVIPAFVISELTTAFQIGFLLFIPFLVIDMVVASVLMSMGMMMLPPIMISMPFKILLFVLVDGWYLIIQSLVTSFG